jgi:hypothetical protein
MQGAIQMKRLFFSVNKVIMICMGLLIGMIIGILVLGKVLDLTLLTAFVILLIFSIKDYIRFDEVEYQLNDWFMSLSSADKVRIRNKEVIDVGLRK